MALAIAAIGMIRHLADAAHTIGMARVRHFDQHRVDSGPGDGSVLYRFVPLVQRPRGALAVALAWVGPGAW